MQCYAYMLVLYLNEHRLCRKCSNNVKHCTAFLLLFFSSHIFWREEGKCMKGMKENRKDDEGWRFERNHSPLNVDRLFYTWCTIDSCGGTSVQTVLCIWAHSRELGIFLITTTFWIGLRLTRWIPGAVPPRWLEYELDDSPPSCKAKLSCYTPWRHLGEEEVQLLLVLDLGTRWG
jgi:hypothetical protein